MAELKTQKTTASAAAFIKKVPDAQKRKDSQVLLRMFTVVTGQKPVMWGTAIVGYGMYHYQSERSTQMATGRWLVFHRASRT